MNPRFTSRAVLAALLAAVALIAGCGGDSAGGDSDPQELLSETFTGDGQVESGVLDISIDAAADGSGGGSLTGSLTGPFESRGDDQVPLIDIAAALDVTGSAGKQKIDGGLTVTENGAYVTTGGKSYEVDKATFDAFTETFAQSAAQQDEGADQSSALFDQLGIDPATWITDVTNEGTEEVGGAETVHISGTPDVQAIFADAQRLDPTGSTGGDPAQLADAVDSATVDVYTGADDKILRKLDLSLELAVPGGSGQTAGFDLSIGISNVNEPQTIEAPANPKPIDDLIPGGLGGIQGLSGGGSGSAGAGAGLGALPGNDKYRECVASAPDPDALAKCADLL